MEPKLSLLDRTSPNGSLLSLRNSEETSTQQPDLLSVPYVAGLPILNRDRQLLYIPAELIVLRVTVKNMVFSAWNNHPELKTQHILLSVLPASHISEYHSGCRMSLLPHGSTAPIHINSETAYEEFHETHNLLLVWADSFAQAKSVNLMM